MAGEGVVFQFLGARGLAEGCFLAEGCGHALAPGGEFEAFHLEVNLLQAAGDALHGLDALLRVFDPGEGVAAQYVGDAGVAEGERLGIGDWRLSIGRKLHGLAVLLGDLDVGVVEDDVVVGALAVGAGVAV